MELVSFEDFGRMNSRDVFPPMARVFLVKALRPSPISVPVHGCPVEGVLRDFRANLDALSQAS